MTMWAVFGMVVVMAVLLIRAMSRGRRPARAGDSGFMPWVVGGGGSDCTSADGGCDGGGGGDGGGGDGGGGGD